jgi:hypothetical protein
MRHHGLVTFILVCATVWLGSAGADLIIRLNDGSQHRLPIEPGEIRSIEFSPSQNGPGGSEPVRSSGSPAFQPGEVIRVGPGRAIKAPSAAARLAVDGSIVEIDAGGYVGDVAVWPQRDLTLRGVGGLVHLRAGGRSAERKAIWVLRGRNVTVENIEFSGCAVPDLNGAGIRFEGDNLTLRNTRFHDNQMGILTSPRPDSEIVIESSEFARNRVDTEHTGRLGHNIYISQSKRLTLRASHIHDAHIGHNVKTRARENFILYNRIEDAGQGSSYLIDLSEGGQAYVIGNLLRQGPNNDNSTLISFGPESPNKTDPAHVLFLVNNTAVNDDLAGALVRNHTNTPVQLINNLFVGPGKLAVGAAESRNNLQTDRPKLRDRSTMDYRLTGRSPAINRGTRPGDSPDGVPLEALQEYVHPLRLRLRRPVGPIDVGAYEYRLE